MKAFLDAIETRLRRRPGWLRTPSAPAILVSDTCFAVRGLVVPWDAISRIRAWRGDPSGGTQPWRDHHGDICLDIAADLDARIITVSESQRGFDDLVAMADRKMTFPLGWWDHLDGPATRRQGTLLFERFTHG
ncbi:hypothetical protein AB4Z32_25080 [Massilia sp. 2TAF26]|uniref:hypothetical protein n=1 Tax=Massilia sp. 2TAF26 TaxID=3233012 RepID=UPI003F99E418